MPRKKVLFVGEWSGLSTGFSTYSLEVMKRLHATGRYELAELACYLNQGDPRAGSCPWTVFPAAPHPQDGPSQQAYSSKITNEFGEWAFEPTLLTFCPDAVVDVRDVWQVDYQVRSPLRPFFNLCWMTTADSEPQADEWLESFAQTDALLTYAPYGERILRQQAGEILSLRGCASPGVDLTVFRPVQSKSAHKQAYGLDPDCLLVGTIMRNQGRKQYPDLFQGFSQYLSQAPPDLARKTFLYCHCAYPDLGWNIPRILREWGIASRTYFTYACRQCQLVFPSLYQDAKGICPRCGAIAQMPTSTLGVDRPAMAAMTNLFDVYVQYSNCLKTGTEVLLRRGWIPIEKVVVGDEAYTHQGRWKKVVRTFQHPSGDAPLDLDVWSDYETLTITSEHPVLAITRQELNPNKGMSIREMMGDRLRNNKTIPEPVFVKACDLRVGDMLAFPIDDRVKDVTSVDLAEYANQGDDVREIEIKVKRGKTYPRYIIVDEAYCRFLGLFAANGSARGERGYAVTVTNHSRKMACHALSAKVLSDLSGVKASIRGYKDKREALNVGSYGMLHAKMLAKACGKKTRKRLPSWSLWLPVSKQVEIIRGLFMGDACYIEGDKVSVYVTTSPELAWQVKHLLRRCRIYYNAHVVIRGRNRKPQYRFEVPKDISSGIYTTARSSTCSLYYNNWHFHKVKSIRASGYAGPVFNFEVEDDNSYTTKLCAVHNSEGFGVPLVEAAACGVPVMAVNYTAMEDFVETLGAIPLKVKKFTREVTTGFYKAAPDVDDLVDNLIRILQMPESMRLRLGFLARRGVEKNYTYELAVQKWEQVLDSLPPPRLPWQAPPRPHRPPLDAQGRLQVPEGISLLDLVRWGIAEVAGRPDLVGSYYALRLARDLTWGSTYAPTGWSPFGEESFLGTRARFRDYNREVFLEDMLRVCEAHNHWDRQRVQRLAAGA